MPADTLDTAQLLKKSKAYQSGHFLLSSGLHSREYVQCQKALQYPGIGLSLCRELASRLLKNKLEPSAIVGPALGAVHMEVFLAMAFCQLLDRDDDLGGVRAVFAEKTENGFEIRRGIELFEQEKVIVVEDVVTTGGSAKKVLELVRKLGAKPIAVASIIDRSNGTVDFGLPFYSLLSLEIETWTQEECVLCKQGLPLVKPGSSTVK